MAEMRSTDMAQRLRQAESALLNQQQQAEDERRQLLAAQMELRKQLQDVVSACNDALRQTQQSVHEALRDSEERHKREMDEIEARSRQLEEQLAGEKTRRERERTIAFTAARSALERAQHEIQVVRKLPCEFFAAGHLDAITEQVRQAMRLCDEQMGQAAAALADAAMTDAVVLGEQVRQANQEWEQLFQVYRSRIEAAAREKEHFEKEQFGREMKPISHEDRNYWSSGLWDDCARQIDELAEFSAHMSVSDRNTHPLRTSELIRALSDVGELEDRQQGLMHCIRQERNYSDERFYIGRDMLEHLEEAGFGLTDFGFVGDEPIDSYEIVLGAFEAGTEDILVVIAPVRQEGVVVRNEIIIQMVRDDLFSQETTQVYMETIERVIRSSGCEMSILRVGEEQQAAVENRRKRPDPQRQIWLHERRNH